MISVRVHKAIPIGGRQSLDLSIVANEPLPFNPGNDHRELLDAEAQAIFWALRDTLPQGTLGRIFAHFAKHYATDLAVAWEALAPKAEGK